MAAFATRVNDDVRDEVNRLRYVKDRLDVRCPRDNMTAVKVRNLLRDLPNAPVEERQLVRLASLDEGIADLDPSWVKGQGGDPVNRSHAWNKIAQFQARFDRLTSQATDGVDLLALYSQGSNPEAAPVGPEAPEDGLEFLASV